MIKRILIAVLTSIISVIIIIIPYFICKYNSSWILTIALFLDLMFVHDRVGEWLKNKMEEAKEEGEGDDK